MPETCAANGWEERLMAVEGRKQAWETGVVRAVKRKPGLSELSFCRGGLCRLSRGVIV